MQVLIIDNSLLIVQRLKEFLSDSTNTNLLPGATSYNVALQMFELHKPRIIILDHHLPENKSAQLLKAVKEVAPKTVVIMLSTENDEYIQQQCHMLGADFLFDKYNEYEKIAVVINEITRKTKFENNKPKNQIS